MKRSAEAVQTDLLRLADALSKPRTIKYLVARFNTQPATLYRWMKMLGNIVRVNGTDRPAKYRLDF